MIDTQATTVFIILFILLSILSFIVAGAEVAFFTLSQKDINLLKTKQQPGYKRVVDLLEEAKPLMGALLIAENFFNIIIIVLANNLLDGVIQFERYELGWLEIVVKAVIIAVILILFCQFLPRMYAKQNNIRFSKDFGAVVEGVFYLFKRPGFWLMRYSDAIKRSFSGTGERAYKMEEIYDVIDISNPGDDENTAKEKDILKGIAKFSNITVKQVMKTRLDVSGIEKSMRFKDVVTLIENWHYSRLPVYVKDLDEIAGMLHSKDLLPHLDEDADFNWHTLIRPAYFVHEHKLIEDLLKEFQSKRIHFAVVVDEFGGTSGIVTLEDIMEEVIGDIRDEFDEDETDCKKLDDYNYIFKGSTNISNVCKFMQLPIETFNGVKGESDTVAGLVLEIAGKIPEQNEIITAGDFDFQVTEFEKNRLKKIKISIRPGQPS